MNDLDLHCIVTRGNFLAIFGNGPLQRKCRFNKVTFTLAASGLIFIKTHSPYKSAHGTLKRHEFPAMRLLQSFWKPLIILLLVAAALVMQQLPGNISSWLLGIGIALGSYQLVLDMVMSLVRRQFVLDYIALAAIITAVSLEQWLVGAVVALMLATGDDLERYSESRAKKALSGLLSRIPHQVTVLQGTTASRVALADVDRGMVLLIKKGEMIPVDGFVAEGSGLVDESSVTGEPMPVVRSTGGLVRAGTVNTGDSLKIQARGGFHASSYARLIRLVEESQEHKPPLVRLADRYSTFFTIITGLLCLGAYLITWDWERVLAVLVLATPCPLIIAAPIAFIGGINAASQQRIIIKHPADLEILARMSDLIFDKTGTITLGQPALLRTEVLHTLLPPKVGLRIAASLEQYSLHPFAKALMVAHGPEEMLLAPTEIHEEIGSGIEGTFGATRYRVQKAPQDRMAVDLCRVDAEGVVLPLLRFHFEDTIKEDSRSTLVHLLKHRVRFHMLTGDKAEEAKKIGADLAIPLEMLAGCTPETKRDYIRRLRQEQKVVAMVGDGINDAPALAEASVSLAFSPEEQTAATDAADIVLLGSGMHLVTGAYHIARRTVRIAKQAMIWGIGMSLVGMMCAAAGFVPPLIGSLLQEAIDVSVILYALRASIAKKL